MAISAAVPLVFLLILSVPYVLLALSDKKSLRIRACYMLISLLVAIALSALFANLDRRDNRSATMPHPFNQVQTAGPIFPAGFEDEPIIKSSLRGLGLWLVVIASGELIRLTLKKPLATELLAGAALLIGGLALIESTWAPWLSLSITLICTTIVVVRRGQLESAASGTGIGAASSAGEPPA
jgi:hypothetical protein